MNTEMRFLLSTIGTVLLLFTFSGQLLAQTAVSHKPAVTASVPIADTSGATITLLRRELAAADRFQDRLLGTVYWALGMVASIAILLVGFGWFANFRVYERDKLALEASVRASTAQQSQASLAAIRAEHVAQVAAARQEMEAFRADMTSHLASLRESQVALAKGAAEAAVKGVAASVKRLERDHREARLKALETDVEIWTLKKSRNNVILSGMLWLELAIDIGTSDMIVAAMLERIAEAFEAGGSAGPWNAPQLQAVLAKLTSVQEVYRERILNLLKKNG